MCTGQTATGLDPEDVSAAIPGIILRVLELMPQPNITENLRIENEANPHSPLGVGQRYPSLFELMEVLHYLTLRLYRCQPAMVAAFSIHRPGKKLVVHLHFLCRRLQNAMRIQKGRSKGRVMSPHEFQSL